jgi:hypothetical protein
MTAIEHEFFRTEPATPGKVVKRCRVLDEFPPACRGLHVDLNHAGIRSDLDIAQPHIGGRWVSFDHHRHLQIAGRRFHGGKQIDVIFRRIQRRKEHVQLSIPRFQRQRRTHHIF